MKASIVFFIWLFFLSSSVLANSNLQFYPLDLEMRYERASSQDFEVHQYSNYAMAYQQNKISALLEYSRYTNSSGNSTASEDYTHQELLLWGRWHFFKTASEAVSSEIEPDLLQISLYGGMGVGAFKDQVKTTFMGLSQTNETGTKILSGLSVGGDLAYSLSKKFSIISTLEGRLLFSPDFDPNPKMSAALRIGGLLKF